MIRALWLRDSITRRFALAIILAVGAAFALNALFAAVGGNFAKPGLKEMGVPVQILTIMRVMDAAPPETRDRLAAAAGTGPLQVTYWGAAVPVSTDGEDVRTGGHHSQEFESLFGSWPGTMRLFHAEDPDGQGAALLGQSEARPDNSYLAVELQDHTWILFTATEMDWGPPLPVRVSLRVGMLLVSILAVALVVARQLARPLDAFAAAARRFGSDPDAPPIPRQGPAEMRAAITAFNDMQSQIQRFVQGQAAMFAAISHDLRTPLTRMRLRGEFIEDRIQQERLFRDVDEMQAMVDAALAFLRDSSAKEATTSLDLPELLRTIADDHADGGTEVAFTGPDHLAFPGRPAGLRRAFANLVDNAVKYGVRPAISLRIEPGEIVVTVSDDGPGIPDHALQAVFMPFQRVDPSRNRHTGGMGLGLTAARAGLRAHGGDVVLSNRPGGGLAATVTLPATQA